MSEIDGKTTDLTFGKPPTTPSEIDIKASANQKDRYDGTTVVGERGLADYLNVFDLDESELVGKRVLDVGSGLLMRFAREAKAKGISVVSLNPEFTDKFVRQEAEQYDAYGRKLRFWQKWRNKLPPRVVGIAQYLPFTNDSFDVVTGFLSVPLYLPPEKEEIAKAFNEMMRVLKPGGNMNFVYWPDAGEKERYIQEELRSMEQSHNHVSQKKQIVENIEANIVKVSKPDRTLNNE